MSLNLYAGELKINEDLTLKEGIKIYLPLPTYWEPKEMKQKADFLQFRVYKCDKFNEVCYAESVKQWYGEHIFFKIDIVQKKAKKNRGKGIFINLSPSTKEFKEMYYADFHPAVEDELVSYMGFPSSCFGKVFRFKSGTSLMPHTVFINMDKNIVQTYIDKQNKLKQNIHPPYLIKGTNCIDHDDGRNGEWLSEMYRRGGVLDSKGCLVDKQKHGRNKLDIPVMIGGEAEEDACGGLGEIRGISRHADGFVAVRSGPGTKYKIIDKIYRNGTPVVMCDAYGKWEGIIYGKGDCGTGTPIAHEQPYSGSCNVGWVYGKYVQLVAG